MQLPIVINESRVASFTSVRNPLFHTLFDGRFSARMTSRKIGCGLFLGIAFLLLPVGQMRLFAQQDAAQDWPPDDAYNGQQSAPDYSQPNYAQPQYTPPQYAPPRYPQPNYPRGPQYAYSQPQYSQPQYAPGPQYGYGQQQFAQPQGYSQQGYGQEQPLSPDELQQLVAPIALYPDNLVAEILAASTYPAQVAAADQWLQAQGNAPPEQIAAEAGAQTSWDPSIKALTAFPQVLAMLDRNLQWTTSLGNAYYNQPQDVMQTIQVMRERAEGAGNLESTPQAEVSNNQGYIDIAPANPQVVYVPTYNPWAVYGQPVQPYPGFSLMNVVGAIGSFLGSSPVQYGVGIAMSAFMGTPFGWLGWGIDWLAHAILFNHGDYFTHSRSVADWGFQRGGPRAYPGRPDWGRGGDRNGWSHDGGYNHSSYARGGFNRPTGGPIGRFGGDARTAEGFNRGFPSRENVYGRPALPAGGNGQFSQQGGRQEQMARGGFGGGYGSDPYGRNGSYGRGQGMFGGRSGLSYGGPSRPSGSPQTNYQRGGFDGRNFGGSQNYSARNSGGFHLFGGGHQSNEFGGRASGGFGGGHSNWGGGGFKAPKASHFGKGGGGHFGGGGGHFGGGGHSGGHGGGGHGGGHHH